MFFNFFMKKIKVTIIIDNIWVKLDEFKTYSVPHIGEFIFYEKESHYYEIVNIIHYIDSFGGQRCHAIVKGSTFSIGQVIKKD